MRINEAGQHHAPAKIDDPRLLSRKHAQLRICTYTDDAISTYSNSLSNGVTTVNGEYSAVCKD
jgi:hypothetical protein